MAIPGKGIYCACIILSALALCAQAGEENQEALSNKSSLDSRFDSGAEGGPVSPKKIPKNDPDREIKKHVDKSRQFQRRHNLWKTQAVEANETRDSLDTAAIPLGIIGGGGILTGLSMAGAAALSGNDHYWIAAGIAGGIGTLALIATIILKVESGKADNESDHAQRMADHEKKMKSFEDEEIDRLQDREEEN